MYCTRHTYSRRQHFQTEPWHTIQIYARTLQFLFASKTVASVSRFIHSTCQVRAGEDFDCGHGQGRSAHLSSTRNGNRHLRLSGPPRL